MAEIEKMTLKELLNCFSMRAIKGKNWEDVREQILSRFAKKDKMIELMAGAMTESSLYYIGLGRWARWSSIEQVTQHYGEKAGERQDQNNT